MHRGPFPVTIRDGSPCPMSSVLRSEARSCLAFGVRERLLKCRSIRLSGSVWGTDGESGRMRATCLGSPTSLFPLSLWRSSQTAASSTSVRCTVGSQKPIGLIGSQSWRETSGATWKTMKDSVDSATQFGATGNTTSEARTCLQPKRKFAADSAGESMTGGMRGDQGAARV